MFVGYRQFEPLNDAVPAYRGLVAAVTLNRVRREAGARSDTSDVVEVELGDTLEDRVRGGKRHPLVMVGEQESKLVAAEPERLAALAQLPSDL